MDIISSPFDYLILAILAFSLVGFAVVWMFQCLKASNSDNDENAKAIYKSQLDDLKHDLDEGQIDENDYRAASIEIGRRMVSAKNIDSNKPKFHFPEKVIFAMVLFGVLSSAIIYLNVGKPSAKDLPFYKREQELLKRDPSTLSTGEIFAILQQKAKENPKDAIPHLMMGKVLVSENRDAEALRAFQASLRRNQANPDALAEIGGVFFRLSGNQDNPETQAALKSAFAYDKDNFIAKFYQGQISWSSGKQKEAIEKWRAIWEKLPPNGSYRIGLINQILDQVSTLEKGPDNGSAPFMAAMMQGQDQNEFIKTMVANRKARLAASPNDIGLRISVAKVVAKTGSLDEAKSIIAVGRKNSQNDAFISQIYDVANDYINNKKVMEK